MYILEKKQKNSDKDELAKNGHIGKQGFGSFFPSTFLVY
jgi:hypothetical protein